MTDLDDRFEALSRARPPELWRDIEGREPRPLPSPPTQRRAIAIVVALAVAAAGLGVSALTFGGSEHPKRTAAAVSDGKIAFAGLGETTWNIYTIEPDGGHLTMLTNLTDQVADDPAWSPDGQWIAYVVRESNGASEIWVINADGSGAYALTSSPGSSWGPTWSPDGSRLAYTHSAPGQADQIWIVGADGSNPRAFTYCDPPECVHDGSPAWSPDGSRIAFVRVSGAGAIIPVSVFIWPAEDSGPKPEAIELDSTTWASDLAWSPDASTLAFARSTSTGASFGLWRVAADGSDLGPLGDRPSAQSPSWSLDGRQIAFMAPIGPERATLYVMDTDGTGVRRIPGLPIDAVSPSWQPVLPDQTVPAPGRSMTNGPIYFRVGGADGGSRIESILPDGTGRHVVFPDGGPVHYTRIDFSPDGTRIAFDNFLEGKYGIETADPEGADVVRLTDGVNDSWASWSPDGTKIVFSSTRYDPTIEGCLPGFPHEYRCPTDIYVMDSDGSSVTRLTDDPAGEFMPRWSPDGRRIAFVREGDLRAGTYEAVYTMRPDGADERQISSGDRGSDFWPSWSPDGTQVVFAAIRDEDWGIWVVDADGSNEHMILGGTGAGYVDNPVWSPDGNLVAFVGNLAVDDYSPDDALYVMRPDGAGVTPIADAPGVGVAGDIAWQPLPVRSASLEPEPMTSTAPAMTPQALAVDPHITASIPIGPQGGTSALLYAEGSVWVTASFVDGGGGIDDAMLFRVDASRNEIVAEIPLDGAPTWTSGGGGLAYGFGSIWVASYGQVDGASQATVQRVDPGSNRVIATIPLGGTWGADVDVDGNSVWAAYFGREHAGVARIDPATDTVAANAMLPSDYVRRITAAGGGVVATELEWSGNGGSPTGGPCTVLTAIDPVTAAIAARERVDPPCGGVQLIEWDGQIWASGARLRRVDPVTARFVGEPIAFDPEHFPRSFVLAMGDEVWFGAYPGGNGNRPDRLARLDGVTGQIEYFIEVGGTDAVFDPQTGTFWVLGFDGTLTRVDLNAS